MRYLEAIDLAKQIRRERPDVLVKVFHYADDAELIVKKLISKRPGFSPVGMGEPKFVKTEEDWNRVKSSL